MAIVSSPISSSSRICLGFENQLSKSTYFARIPAWSASRSSVTMTSVALAAGLLPSRAARCGRPDQAQVKDILSLGEESSRWEIGRNVFPSDQPNVSSGIPCSTAYPCGQHPGTQLRLFISGAAVQRIVYDEHILPHLAGQRLNRFPYDSGGQQFGVPSLFLRC